MFIAGCVHGIPLTPYEQCASQGMVLSGITMSTTDASAVAYSPRGGVAVANGVEYGQSVSCRRAASPQDLCELAAANSSAAVKLGYEPFGRNVLIGLGTLAFIVPGIALSIGFHIGRHDTEAEAANAATTTLTSCPAQLQQGQEASGPPVSGPSAVPAASGRGTSASPAHAPRFCFDKVQKSGGDTVTDCFDSLDACNRQANQLGMLWNQLSECAVK